MKRIALFLLMIPALTHGQVSEKTTVSVITCGPSQEELYTAFGHSAFRVHDPESGYDAIYNYGVFNFRQKHFYLNFARGYLYYQLGVHDYRDFEYHYISDNRFIHEQVLNLNQSQKQKLIEFLEWNALPENQHYRYDYFYDNCATKIRDVIKNVFGDSVEFSDSHINTNYTIRELTDLYLVYQPWGDLGIDICLGLPMDKKAAPIEYMFLPDFVEAGFDNAVVLKENGKEPLVLKKVSTFEAKPQEHSTGVFTPLNVFSLLFIIAMIISYRDWSRKRLTHVFDVILFSVLGSVGLLLLLLWVATDHRAAAKNFNLLWAIPTHLIASVAFIRQPQWLK
ncbi:MAG TPA: DUF4105 domain-containing protein, partial [Chryseosolibacter sp.]|nr:DUF4105 domain-containing protein [Chryseosolibacter sp.]